jgi:hypothetical protein
MPLPMGRPRGKVACPGPHTEKAWRGLADLLCRDCWHRLPEETRRRLRLSGGSGRINPADRYAELRDQLAAGVPLNQIEVSE